jgi:carbamoyl-phosphate synthase small subunit
MSEQRWNWRAQREKSAYLALEDGTILYGWSFGAPRDAVGEVVFNTGMTGYQEVLTDPSYSGQFVTMTYTEIGNTGINRADAESRQTFLNGFIIHDLNPPANWRADESLDAYLQRSGVPAIAGLDTRALTGKIRDQGTMKAYLGVTGTKTPDEGLAIARAWPGLDGQDYACQVTCAKPAQWDPDGALTTSWGIADELPAPDLKIVAFDYGIKWNILRSMRKLGMEVQVVPAKTTAAAVLKLKPDAVFLSNGPADPAAVLYAIEAARGLLGKVPIMGICLGHQLLGLASGARTYRLKFGHHGSNHPVMDLATRAVEITTQNHNYALDPKTLAEAQLELTHVNLNDNTVEGIRHRREPMFAVQYHPEAGPGPHDSFYLFRRFRELIAKA